MWYLWVQAIVRPDSLWVESRHEFPCGRACSVCRTKSIFVAPTAVVKRFPAEIVKGSTTIKCMCHYKLGRLFHMEYKLFPPTPAFV